MIQAGFFECDITPPYMTDCPGDFSKRKILHFSDPLKMRALALSDGTKKVALIGADNIGCGAGFLKKLKENLPGISLIYSSSHTHYGGVLNDKFPGIDEADEVIRRIVLEESVAHDPNYYEFCMHQAITAVTYAFDHLQDVDFSFGKGRVENLIFNRRIRMKDGSARTHAGKGNPDAVGYAGPVDDELGVMGIWKKDSDELLGFALNFSCHACINLEGATADFPGVAINTVRAVFGEKAGAVYLNGASGDVTQIDNLSLRKDTGKPIAIKLGRAVGAEAIKILATADHGPIENLNYLGQSYTFRFRPLDETEIKESYDKIQVFENSNDYKIAKSLVMQSISRKANPSPKADLGVLQIGPLVIGSVPCEFFAQFALNFKAQSAFPFTWLSQLSFIRCYIPTADAFDPVVGGGYEASTAQFVPETGDEIIGIVSQLAKQFSPESVPQPQTVPPVKQVWGYNFKRK
ncbi:MAG: hypothetical protein J6X55_17290 [Victivallales bacterium]|nr:hypothetical protein [Victivallales bacterium]